MSSSISLPEPEIVWKGAAKLPGYTSSVGNLFPMRVVRHWAAVKKDGESGYLPEARYSFEVAKSCDWMGEARWKEELMTFLPASFFDDVLGSGDG